MYGQGLPYDDGAHGVGVSSNDIREWANSANTASMSAHREMLLNRAYIRRGLPWILAGLFLAIVINPVLLVAPLIGMAMAVHYYRKSQKFRKMYEASEAEKEMWRSVLKVW